MDLGLKDTVALVSAASKGLGRAIAEGFAREGAKVSMCSREEEACAEAAAAIAKATGSQTLSMSADLSTPEGCTSFIDRSVDRFGRIDVLVVNAGGPPPGRFDELDESAWDKSYQLTLMSAVRLTKLALPHLRKTKGNIVYSTSTAVRMPTLYLNLILSNAFRSGVHGMLKTLSKDLAKDGIRVNAVMPGRIATDRLIQLDTIAAQRTGRSLEEVRQGWEREWIPLGRYGTPEEYANAVVFLASERASYITGVSLQVDGGMLMSSW